MTPAIAPTERDDDIGTSEQRLDYLARRHSVLGSPIRLRILELLVQGIARTGADLTKKIPGVSRQNILNHVRALIDVGFIFKRGDHSLVVCPEAFFALFTGTQDAIGFAPICS